MARRGNCCRCSCSIEPVFVGVDGFIEPPPGFSQNAPLPEAAVAVAADLIRALPAVIDGTTPQTSELKVCADGIGCGVLSRVIVPPVPTETYNAGYTIVAGVRVNSTGTTPTTAVWTWPSNSWSISLNGQSRRTNRAELSLLMHRESEPPLATVASFYRRGAAFSLPLPPPPKPIDLIRTQQGLHAQESFAKNLDGFQSLLNEPARFYFPLATVTRKAAIQKVDIYWRPSEIVSISPGGQFPEQGRWGVVYLTLSDNKIYRWNDESQDYEEIDATLDPSGALFKSVENPNFASSLNGTFISSAISAATNEEGSYFMWVTMSPNTSRQFFYPLSFVVDRTPPLATLAQTRDWFADEAGFTNVADPLSLTLEATEPCGISGAIGVQPASLAAGEHTRQLQGGPYRDRAGNDLPHTPSAAFTVHGKPADDRYGALASFGMPDETTSLYESGVTQLVLRFDRPVCGLTAGNILIEKLVGPGWVRTAIGEAGYEITPGTSRKEWIITILEEQPPNSLWYATFRPIRAGASGPNVFVVPPGIEHLTTPATSTNYGAVYWNADEKKDYVFTGPGSLEEATPERLAASPGLAVVSALPSQGNCRTVYQIQATGARYLFLGGSYVTSELRDTSRPVTYHRTVANVGSLPLVGHPDTKYFTPDGERYWSDRGGLAANYADDSVALRQLYGISEACRLAARTTWVVLPEVGKNAEPADVRMSRVGTIGDVSSVSGTVNETLHGEFIDADDDSENAPTQDVSVSSTNGLRPRMDGLSPEYSSRTSAGFLPRLPPSATEPNDAVGRFSYWGLGTTIYPSPPALIEECSPPTEDQRHSSAIFSAGKITALHFSFRTTVEWANVAQVQAGINALVTSVPEYSPCPCTLCDATGKLAVCVEYKGGECVQYDIVNCHRCGGDGVDQCLGYKTVTGGGGFSLSSYIAYLANPPVANWSGVFPSCGPSPYPAAKESYLAATFSVPPYKIGEVTLEPFTVNASSSEPQNTWTATNLSATAWRNFTEYLPLQTAVVDGLVLRADGRKPYETTGEVCGGDPPDMGGFFRRIAVVVLKAGVSTLPPFPADAFVAVNFTESSIYAFYQDYAAVDSPGTCDPIFYVKKNSEGTYDRWTPSIAIRPGNANCDNPRGTSGVVYVSRLGGDPSVWIESGTRGAEVAAFKVISRQRGFHAWAVEEQLTRAQEETLASGGTVEWLDSQEFRALPKSLGKFPGWAAPFDNRPNTAENVPFRNAEQYALDTLSVAVNYYVSVRATLSTS